MAARFVYEVHSFVVSLCLSLCPCLCLCFYVLEKEGRRAMARESCVIWAHAQLCVNGLGKTR